MNALRLLFLRELSLAWGGGGGPLMACAFFTGIGALLPLAVGPSPEQLAAVSTGAAWLALSLASLLSLERLFERDYEDGALEMLSLGPLSLQSVAAIKCTAQWVANGLPLALLAPIVAMVFGASAKLAPAIFGTALIGGVGFAFIGGIGAALSLGARRGGLLIAVIVLPLFAPPMIFGAGAVESLSAGLPWEPGVAFLAAFSLAAAALGPFAMAAAVRNALS